MNGGRTVLDIAAIEGFTNNLKSKKEEIDVEYQKMRQAADDLGSVAFKGDIVAKINEAMYIIEKDKTQIEHIVTRFIDFLNKVKIETIQRDQEAATSISNSAQNISQLRK